MTSGRDKDPRRGVPWDEGIAPPKALSEAICRECTRDLTNVRSRGGPERLLVSTIASLAIAGGFAAVVSAQSSGVASRFGVAILGLVAQTALLVVGLGALRRRFSLSARRFAALAGPTALVGLLWLSSDHCLSALEFFAGSPLASAARCASVALVVGGITALSTFAIWRKTDPFTPRLSGAIAGLCGGLMGAAAVGLACPSAEAWHLGFGHGLSTLCLAGMGWLVGGRFFAP